jgi:diguanylate cyclase (GGDEF)-like protein/PAS domain S-box-containing protein
MADDLMHVIKQLRTTLGKLEMALSSTVDAIVWTNDAGQIQWCNGTFDRLVGQPHLKVLNRRICELLPLRLDGSPLGPDEHPISRLIRGENVSASSYEYDRDGQQLALELSGARVQLEAKEGIDSLIVTIRDISERKQAEAQLDQLAHYDAVTSLPNRRLFARLLSRALMRAVKSDRMVALLFLDIDRFKLINDTLGHLTGDLLLQAIAAQLTQCLRPSDTLSRLGGDEFTVILEDIGSLQDVARVAQRMTDAFSVPFQVAGHQIFTSVSIGIALYPADAPDQETLLKHADTALYAAKEHRASFRFYSSDMHDRVMDRLTLNTGLRMALHNSEFVLHYQPLIESRAQRIVGIEALIRWQHPQAGLLYPDSFIQAAEETGLIVPIGEWVLATACRQTKAWQDMGHPDLRVAVNISSRQFQQPRLIERIAEILNQTGLNPQYLELELTERSLFQDTERTVAALTALQTMGIRVAIDDFGTEYSSLGYLRRFPVHALKIDRSFMREIPENSSDSSIVKAVVALAHCLNLKVVAEGVETEAQVEFLQRHDCNEMQGYYFARPVHPVEIGKLLEGGGDWQSEPLPLEAGVRDMG